MRQRAGERKYEQGNSVADLEQRIWKYEINILKDGSPNHDNFFLGMAL